MRVNMLSCAEVYLGFVVQQILLRQTSIEEKEGTDT